MTQTAFNELINAGVDARIKAVLRDFACQPVKADEGFALDDAATAIEAVFESVLVK